MIIRNLQKSDLEAIENIFSLYWPEEEFREKLTSRLKSSIDNDSYSIEQELKYLVAEDNGEVVGAIGFRKTPKHMIEFVKTEKPAELYIMAVKNRGSGIGRALIQKALEKIKSLGCTETVHYSGETHQDSWGFYDHLGFERVGPALAPNGEPGQIWRMSLTEK